MSEAVHLAASAPGASAERRKWWLVFGALVATTLGAAPVMVLTFGVFLKPIDREFGWSRETLSLGLLLATLLNALVTPAFGRLIDRHGVRVVTLTSIALFAACTCSISLLTASKPLLLMLFCLWGITSAGHSQLPYVTAISRTFSTHRGLALSLGLMGVGIGTTLVPALAARLLLALGWRHAYIALGGITFLVAFTAVYLWVRPAEASVGGGRALPSEAIAPSRSRGANSSQPGSMARDYLRTWQFWAIGAGVFLFATGVLGVTANAVPLMSDFGLSPVSAADKMTILGLAAILGRVLCGYLLDKFHPALISAIFFAWPAVGILGLSLGNTAFLIPALASIGVAVGAESPLGGVLVSQYLGLERFGEVFGYIALAFSFGVACGPWVFNLLYDHTGAYSPGLAVAGCCVMVAGLLVGSLAWYPQAALARET